LNTIDRVNKIILAAIDDLNSQLTDEGKLERSVNTVLYGKKSKLDSFGLVNLIVDIEQRIQDEFGVSINLADEKALSQKNSPFLTAKSLSDYIINLLEANVAAQ
jgi:acyl carrier protein